ncbi:NBS-LRR resistance-like protein [Artemisia annua]|uniref:NBS-LRR resistance-like protein n=1 Tax=Artemisia annua TaxID=35608 RepID=A0A2U1MA37_ARTAN|nr:NBS-LRR resistance-like protein [Artemisia annua]
MGTIQRFNLWGSSVFVGCFKLKKIFMEQDTSVKFKLRMQVCSLGLIVIRPKTINRKSETSMVHASSIVGRQEEKDELIHKLLQHDNEACNQNFSIVPIVGIGGVECKSDSELFYFDRLQSPIMEKQYMIKRRRFTEEEVYLILFGCAS